jgi:hypothetical protein
MQRDRRRAGRAIRKQRRLEREAIARALTYDFTPVAEALAEFGRVIAESVAQFVRVIEPRILAVRQAGRGSSADGSAKPRSGIGASSSGAWRAER